MVKKIEKSIPWIIIFTFFITVFLGIGIVFKETMASNLNYRIIVQSSNAVPVVGTVILNGSNNITLTENVTTTIQATTTVSDTNGYNDINSVQGKIYRSGVGSSCSANDNNCYSNSACATSSCSGNSCIATCNYNIWFFSDPTDAGDYSSQYWEAWIKATDNSNASSSATSTGVEVNTLYALDLSTTTIDYGSLNSGSTTNNTNQTVTCTTTGNAAIDLYLYGTDMEKGPISISVGYQEWSTSTFTYGNGTALTSVTSTAVEMDLSKPTNHPSTSSDDLYWGAEVPSATPKGNYSGTTTFEAKTD